VICKREPDEVGIIIFMKMLSFLCRNWGNLRESLRKMSQLVVEGYDFDICWVYNIGVTI
jgi:hypothetical protein